VKPSLLDQVLAPGGLTARFEAIADVGAHPLRPCYFEGLIRGPVGTNLETADILFSYIRRKGEGVRMDRLCVSTVLAAAQTLPPHAAIGLNVEASTLAGDPGFPEYLACVADSRGIAASRLVVEIVEQSRPANVGAFRAALAALRAARVRIALDDVGCAHSNYRMMLETRPDFFKIDRYLVGGASTDPLRRKVMRSIAALGRSFGARVVAEGIESARDLRTVRALGIDLVQGYFVPSLLEPKTSHVA
jgi:EAL domain-containing protein (putative c-di-GMP-specific phosphodiesterase class I)